MTSNWQIAGHKKQQEFLLNSIAKRNLAHAYIFSGPTGVGKHAVALKFAQSLLCEKGATCGECGQCRSFFLQNNPDFIEFAMEDSMKIEHIRDLIFKLSLKPYLALYKVAIIDRAEEMTVEAANALLKVLEEPKPNTVIILITSNSSRLLRTISSRAQKINFGPLEPQEFEHLIPSNISKEKKELIKTVAGGKPGLAIRIATNEEFLESLAETNAYYEKFLGANLTDRLVLAFDISQKETAEIKTVLDFWLARMELGLKTDTSRGLAKKIDLVNKARRYLDQNVNAKLLLTNLMLNL
jgi:DNA polymerase III delta' subunit